MNQKLDIGLSRSRRDRSRLTGLTHSERGENGGDNDSILCRSNAEKDGLVSWIERTQRIDWTCRNDVQVTKISAKWMYTTSSHVLTRVTTFCQLTVKHVYNTPTRYLVDI